MVISPVINGFGAILAVVAYHVYKYLYLWVLEQRTTLDTGGEFFPRAVTHVFVGIYIGEVALTIIFFGKGHDTLPQAILMVILIVASLIVHYMLVTSYRPLLHPLPLSLAHLTHGQPSADAKAGTSPRDGSFGMRKEPPEVDAEEAMWYSDPAGKERPGLRQRKSTASMRSWRSPTHSPHLGAADKPTITTSSPAVPPLSLPPQQAVAMQPEDVEMSDLGVRQSTITGSTAVAPSPTDAVPSPTSDETGTDEITEDQHSQAPLGRRRSSVGRRMSVGPWEDHRHARRQQPHWELRRTSTVGSLEANQEDISKYFARPGGPGVIRPPDDSAAPAAFFHPATHQPQPIVWLPLDELGIARDQVKQNRKEGVKSTTRNAVFDTKNRVLVKGPAPDDK
jgi:hypothetical protein